MVFLDVWVYFVRRLIFVAMWLITRWYTHYWCSQLDANWHGGFPSHVLGSHLGWMKTEGLPWNSLAPLVVFTGAFEIQGPRMTRMTRMTMWYDVYLPSAPAAATGSNTKPPRFSCLLPPLPLFSPFQVPRWRGLWEFNRSGLQRLHMRWRYSSTWGGFHKWGYLKWDGFIMENPIKMDDSGVPLF